MAKPSININFAQGLDTKSDPKQVQIGKFLKLVNSVFQIGGLLSKRPGYGPLTNITPNSYLTTLNDNLISVGNTVSAYVESLNKWVTKGNIQPCGLNVMPLIRNNINKVQSDCAIANGMVLTVFTSNNNNSLGYFYAIADSTTGQNIVEQSSLPVISNGTISGSSRTFVVGNFFVVVSQVSVSGTNHLQYFSIPITNPSNPSAAQSVTSEVYAAISSNPGWDGAVSSNTLVIAYNSTTTAQGVHVASLTETQIASNSVSGTIHQFNNAAYIGAIVSVCVDLTSNPNIFYISFWNNSTTNTYTCAVYIGFGTISVQFAPANTIGPTAIANLASAAQNGYCLLFSEAVNNYSYDSSIPSNFINGRKISSAGVGGTPYVAIKGVGLASKAFVINGTIYFLSAFQSPFQPSFFLINGSQSTSATPVIVSKLAYQNGGGYLSLGLPNVTTSGNVAQISYLFTFQIQAVTGVANSQMTSSGGIYGQTGVNLATFTLGTGTIDTAEIASNLFLSGGFLGQFDGHIPVENNFLVWPDSVECSWSASGGSIHAQPDGSTNTNAYYYQVTYEWQDNQGLIYRSTPSIAVGVTTSGGGTSGSITVHVPYLRLTMKTVNTPKIVIYRWSVASQVYQQVTSISAPQLNDTTSDSLAYVDTLADASIAGNNIIYTTGGVQPDVSGPANNGIMGLFNNSLVMMDAENPNTAWVSKTVVPGAPVEMSPTFTIFIPSSQGVQKSLGPVTACAPMDDKFVFFFAEGACYINGSPPNITGATAIGCSLGNYSNAIAIASSVGCTNQASIVMISEGLMFQSNKGIWLLNRFNLQTSYIGAAVEAFNNQTVTSAVVIPKTTYVLFTLNSGTILMYDYFYGQWGTFGGIQAVSSCIQDGLHTILDNHGNTLQETPGLYLDNQNPVLMNFLTSWISLAGIQGYERFYWLYFLGDYISPHLIDVSIAYNYNASLRSTAQITPHNFSSAVPSPYGDQPAPFGSPASLEQWLVHAKYQKCESFQIAVQELYDPSFGVAPGAGFTCSGLNLIYGVKRSSRPINQTRTAG